MPAFGMQKLPGSFCGYSSLCARRSDCTKTSKYSNRTEPVFFFFFFFFFFFLKFHLLRFISSCFHITQSEVNVHTCKVQRGPLYLTRQCVNFAFIFGVWVWEKTSAKLQTHKFHGPLINPSFYFFPGNYLTFVLELGLSDLDEGARDNGKKGFGPFLERLSRKRMREPMGQLLVSMLIKAHRLQCLLKGSGMRRKKEISTIGAISSPKTKAKCTHCLFRYKGAMFVHCLHFGFKMPKFPSTWIFVIPLGPLAKDHQHFMILSGIEFSKLALNIEGYVKYTKSAIRNQSIICVKHIYFIRPELQLELVSTIWSLLILELRLFCRLTNFNIKFTSKKCDSLMGEEPTCFENGGFRKTHQLNNDRFGLMGLASSIRSFIPSQLFILIWSYHQTTQQNTPNITPIPDHLEQQPHPPTQQFHQSQECENTLLDSISEDIVELI
ncbi:hypothetical protein VP01_3482g3 [Puccinia sorghi]|uniref:Uncharacterized protein n=1 Tax=Puccinia sorghi TaxID=27349 RepID=A0A0L6UW05_9BASI|nr:hypothetical protein VP01_3482g3 [Puccinia sorghi]